MRRLFGVLLAAAVLVAAAPGLAHAGQAAAKLLNALGSVSAVSPTSMTVKSGSNEWVFTIDKDTSVTAKGGTHKSLALKADGKSPMLTDFIKVGDGVTVSYHEMGSMKHAASISLRAPSPKK
jgi:uncharacterized cupredoxin-like copper-binding protein